MNSVWLITKQQDYESEETLCVYRDKPSEQMLLDILTRQYGITDEHLVYLSTELYTNGVVRVWDMDTYHICEWELK